MKIIEVLQAQELHKKIDKLPPEVWTLLGDSQYIRTDGEGSIRISGRGDYGTIEQWQAALAYLVNQFGGSCTWDECPTEDELAAITTFAELEALGGKVGLDGGAETPGWAVLHQDAWYLTWNIDSTVYKLQHCFGYRDGDGVEFMNSKPKLVPPHVRERVAKAVSQGSILV